MDSGIFQLVLRLRGPVSLRICCLATGHLRKSNWLWASMIIAARRYPIPDEAQQSASSVAECRWITSYTRFLPYAQSLCQ